jgi:cell division protein FtsB
VARATEQPWDGSGTRLQRRTAGLRFLNRLAFAALFLSLGAVAVVMTLPQRKKTAEMEQALRDVRERECETLARREHHQAELRALKEDPKFLELKARDRLDMYREGEKVLRFDRDVGLR